MVDVRSYILTERERRILRRYIETGEKLDGFAVLVHHLKKHKDAISEDLGLLKASLQKVSSDRMADSADEALRRAAEKKKARLRTTGPYRKAHIEGS